MGRAGQDLVGDGVILDISERTVNVHCDQAMKRLDVVNWAQAVARAIAAGMIAP